MKQIELDFSTEVWGAIPGFDGRYYASDAGRIKRVPCKNFPKTAIKSQRINKNGYRCVNIRYKGVLKQFSVHRLVMFAFHGVKEKSVDHINGDPLDNRLENLRYCTNYENSTFSNKKFKKQPTSKYMGVFFHSTKKTWRARTTVDGKKISIIESNSEEKAARAYVEFREHLGKRGMAMMMLTGHPKLMCHMKKASSNT